MNSPTAAYRSATHGPWYNSRAASANGLKSISVAVPPDRSSFATAAAHAAGARSSPKN